MEPISTTKLDVASIIELDNKDMYSISDDSFKNLIESVKFMSDKFDSFSKNMQELISTVKCIKEEIQILKDKNIKLTN